jgi:hypothetical protein
MALEVEPSLRRYLVQVHSMEDPFKVERSRSRRGRQAGEAYQAPTSSARLFQMAVHNLSAFSRVVLTAAAVQSFARSLRSGADCQSVRTLTRRSRAGTTLI